MKAIPKMANFIEDPHPFISKNEILFALNMPVNSFALLHWIGLKYANKNTALTNNK
jgi:hypothetical protein